jgi:hypothetical protein
MSFFVLSCILTFWCYLIQDAELFEALRHKVKFHLQKKLAMGSWLAKFPYKWLTCVFCLTFVLSVIGLPWIEWWQPMAQPPIVALLYKLAFRWK